MANYKKHSFLLLFLLLIFLVNAQEGVLISREDVFQKVLEANATKKIAEQDFIQAKADYSQTNAVFLPNISASYTGMATTNPLMAFGSKLNQEILTANDFNPALLNDPNQIENYATTFKVEQPLVNLDGIYQRKAAKYKMNAMELKQQRTTDYLDLETQKAYMQLQLAYKNVAVLETVLNAVNANLKIVNNSYEQGYVQQAEVLMMKVRLTEVQNQLQYAKSNVANASNYLSFLMNENTNVVYKPTDSLTINMAALAVGNSVENRTDVKAMQMVSEAYENAHKADKMSFLPRLNAFGSYEMYDDEIFKADANGYTFGAQLSWDLFEGSKRFGKAKKSKSEYEKAQLQYNQYVSKSNLELNQAHRNFTNAKNKLELTQLALEQSKEVLRIKRNRFEEGLEKTADLLMAESQYAQKQLEYQQTIFEYNYALAYLQYLTKE